MECWQSIGGVEALDLYHDVEWHTDHAFTVSERDQLGMGHIGLRMGED
jgi:hypothetical protein